MPCQNFSSIGGHQHRHINNSVSSTMSSRGKSHGGCQHHLYDNSSVESNLCSVHRSGSTRTSGSRSHSGHNHHHQSSRRRNSSQDSTISSAFNSLRSDFMSAFDSVTTDSHYRPTGHSMHRSTSHRGRCGARSPSPTSSVRSASPPHGYRTTRESSRPSSPPPSYRTTAPAARPASPPPSYRTTRQTPASGSPPPVLRACPPTSFFVENFGTSFVTNYESTSSTSTVRPTRRSPSPSRRTTTQRRRSPSPPVQCQRRTNGIGISHGHNSHRATSASSSRTQSNFRTQEVRPEGTSSRIRAAFQSFRTQEVRPESSSSKSHSSSRQESSRRESTRHTQSAQQPSRSHSTRSRTNTGRTDSRPNTQRPRSPPPPSNSSRAGSSSGRERSSRTEQGSSSTRSHYQNAQNRFDAQAQGSTASAAPTRSPSDLKSLFDAYNAKWDSLSRTDSNFPLPAPLSNLFKLDFAGGSSSNIGNFKAEDVMITNVQLIFLAGFGISGTIERFSDGLEISVSTSDKKGQNAAALTKWLKRTEQSRLHPDRMNLRTGIAGKVDTNISKRADVVALRTAAQNLLETLST